MKILILGATSAIAQSVARHLAKEGAELFLVARNAQKLQAVCDDLKVRGAVKIEKSVADLDDRSRHRSLIAEAVHALGSLDVVLICHGILSNQRECEADFEKAYAMINTNFLSNASLAQEAALYLEPKHAGTIAVIGSVAGDRGRQSNFYYGASKAGLECFLQGLRNRLFASQVHVVTIKPGFVDTPMTASYKKGPLFASSDQVAKGIVTAIRKKKDVVYLPRFWQLIMWVICSIPERIFKRLNL